MSESRQEISIELASIYKHTTYIKVHSLYLNGEIRPRHWRLIAPIVVPNRLKTAGTRCDEKHSMADNN